MLKKAISWLSLAGFTTGAGYFWQKGDAEVAIGVLGILVTIIIALLQSRGSEEKKNNSRIKSFLNGRDFKKQYFTLLRYQNRDFDIKGLSTQTVHTLDLEQVFVELKFQPQVAHNASPDPFNRKKSKLPAESYSIWRFFGLLGDNEKAKNAKIVIIGPPGSGKTTLLKHTAILLVHPTKPNELKKSKFNKIPILLFLRDHVKDVTGNSSVLLPQLVETTIAKWDVHAPLNWFHKQMKDGNCLVMLDGLDEVADIQARHKIVTWIEHQMRAYPKNTFILTSRPHGYKEFPLTGVSVLEVMPFNRSQIDIFVQNWYLANEIKSHLAEDMGVRMSAKTGADDLLRRLEKSPTLMELAVNPLLLTMIATVHRYRSALPGRRVELYKEICEVFLGKRQEAKGLELDLIPAQKQSVLQSLAYEMMYNNVREIRLEDAVELIRSPLALVGSNLQPVDFLKNIEQQSGLLIEREMGIYSFAHKTFQEYLTAMHMLDTKLEDELKSRINDDWWHEVIKLFVAQTDATNIITVCIDQDPPNALALSLGIQCLEEARQVQPYIKNVMEKILQQTAEDEDPEIRNIVAQALLANRIKHLTALSPTVSIDTKLITNAEYQVFVDDMMLKEAGDYYPTHWSNSTFPAGSAHTPVYGLTPNDALSFCEWLTDLHAGSGEWFFRLPLKNEIDDTKYSQSQGFWTLVDAKARNSEGFKKVEFWSNPKLNVPNIPESFIKQTSENEIRTIIAILHNDKNFADLDHDLYFQLGSVLRKIVRNLSNANELLSETASDLYKSLLRIPTNRALDFAYGSPDPEAYDQSISDFIDRISNPDFEAGIMNAIKCFSHIVNSNPRSISNYKTLFVAFGFSFLLKWAENTKIFFTRNSMIGIQRKIDFITDLYVDDLIGSARQQKVVQPFEGLLIVKEIRKQSLL